jgi:hypothetical protein
VSSFAATRVSESTPLPVYALRIVSKFGFAQVSNVTVPPLKVAS